MKTISYFLFSMHCIKYYIPLIERFKNYKNIIYYFKGKKMQCPITNFKYFQSLSKIHNFEIKKGNEFKKETDILFLIEGVYCPINDPNRKYKIISINYCTDFFCLMPSYIKNVDYVINAFNYEMMNFFYNSIKNSEKNHCWRKYLPIHNSQMLNEKQKYFQLSKYYNIKNFNGDKIFEKYNISKNKKCVFFFLPRNENIIPLKDIFDFLIKKDYILLLKTRNKHEYSDSFKLYFKNNKNIHYFNDTNNYYPSVALEFMYISEFVFQSNSSGWIEAIMLNKPILNYNVTYKEWLTSKILKKKSNFYFCVNNLTDFSEKYNTINTLLKNKDKMIDDFTNFKNEYFSKKTDNEFITFIKSLLS